MLSPAVSGSQGYRELTTAAKAEERRLAALKQRQEYAKVPGSAATQPSYASKPGDPPPRTRETPSGQPPVLENRKCYNCGRFGHIAPNCPRPRQESRGRAAPFARTQQVHSQNQRDDSASELAPEDFLYSSSDDEQRTQVNIIRLTDHGSLTKCVKVSVQGIPAYGLIDSGADITILGGSLFKRIATIARLKKKNFKKADKVPKTYDQQPFRLDGRMDLDVAFGDKQMTTPVYIKMDAHDQLLLSEGVCHQLGVIQYHADVETWRGGRKRSTQEPSGSSRPGKLDSPVVASEEMMPDPPQEAKVPSIRVDLIRSIQLLPHQSKIVEVTFTGDEDGSREDTYLLEPADLGCGLRVDPSLLSLPANDDALAVITNPTGCSMVLEEGSALGDAMPATVVASANDGKTVAPERHSTLRQVQSKPVAWRQQELMESIGSLGTLAPSQRQKVLEFLKQHHAAFALEENERGETDLVEMTIDTGDAKPQRCPPRRMPFAVRGEVARQLDKMQATGVIQPSASPWSSPVVMVRKKDGSHRFCIDYRQLNSVTKADTYPLPRIDDLLDQLGCCKFFSTLDLASGYWQIRVSPSSQEKTAFVTPQGLYEFKVMPFGLTNAPAVFQRLMQRLLMGLNPESGPDFVAVYIDDALIFSPTLDEHIDHLKAVVQRVNEAGLKFKPSKCQFIRQEVEYLGHIVTPQGLKPNKSLVEAITEFPHPTDVSGVRRFVGLASYYRRFVGNFARITEPLRQLNATFSWTSACEAAMTKLKEKLTTAPILAYPAFDRPFTMPALVELVRSCHRSRMMESSIQLRMLVGHCRQPSGTTVSRSSRLWRLCGL